MKKLSKKLFISSIVLALFSILSLFLHPASVYADSDGYFDGREGDKCQVFIGLTSWDCGVHIKTEDDLRTQIWQIAANVATDATIISAYLVLGFIIYGGYIYMFSGGDSGKVASGKKTLVHAFIGLAIVLLANVIITSIRIALLGADGKFNCTINTECLNSSEVISNAINWVIGIAGFVSAIFVVYGGITYATSAGDPSKLQKAKSSITYALIGLAIVALSMIISAFVSGIINQAT